MVARNKVVLWARMPVLLKLCFSRRHPPENIARPRTRSRLPMMEPVIEALTRSTSPARSARIPMMSSGALPKLALRRPPRTGLVLVARSSVDRPINLASGTMASAERKNSTTGDTPASAAPMASGTNARSATNRLSIACRTSPIRPQRRTGPFQSGAAARPRSLQPTISLPAKNCTISFCAVSGASEP